MAQNVDKVVERGENIDTLGEKAGSYIILYNWLQLQSKGKASNEAQLMAREH